MSSGLLFPIALLVLMVVTGALIAGVFALVMFTRRPHNRQFDSTTSTDTVGPTDSSNPYTPSRTQQRANPRQGVFAVALGLIVAGLLVAAVLSFVLMLLLGVDWR